MKTLICFLLVLSFAFSLTAQEKKIVANGLLDQQIIDREKKAFNPSIVNKENNVASTNNFDITYFRCEWNVDPAIRYITGKVTSYFTIVSPSVNIVFDLSDTLTVDSITWHGNKINFQRIANDGLQLQFPATLNAGQADSVSIFYQGVPRASATYEAFNFASHSGVPIIYTLSEPYGGKEWWPCKNGLTDKADSIDVIITSPASYNAVSNGVLTDSETSGAWRTVHYKHRYPIATYLIAIAITNYVTDIDSAQINGKSVPLVMNAYPEYEDYFKDATFFAKQSIVKFSELFGEYPFSKEQYSQTQCEANGGMENQTNTFIGNAWNQLVAHELGHHWFGDNVTCGSWQHIWLNEGFANYMQFIYVQNFDTTLIAAHLQYYLNLITSQPAGSVFVTDTTNPSRIFDNRLTYAKGGYVVHMLRGILGDSIFFKGLRQYLNDPLLKNKFAVTADLERNLEQASGKNLQTFFKKWIYGEGYANYNATWMQNNNQWIKVQLYQTTSDASVSFYDMPVQLEFKNNTRDTIVTVNNQQSGETFWINPGFAPDTMIIDPNYWILAKNRVVQKISAQSNVSNDIKIYPNPAPDNVFISLLNPSGTTLSIRLFSAVGQLIYTMQKKLSGQDELITVPVAQLAKGTYIVEIIGDKGIKTTKKIIR